MIKTINIDDSHSIELNCSMGWLLVYRNQFGKDILPELLPAVEAITELMVGMFQENNGMLELNPRKLLKNIENDSISDAFITLSGMEFTTLIQMVWAMAKNNNKDIKPVMEWINEFENFPLDVIVPEVIKAICESSVSTKNLKRLQSQGTKKSPSKK